MTITVTTKQAGDSVTLEFPNGDRQPITQQSGQDAKTTFSNVTEDCRISNGNDRIIDIEIEF